MKELALNEVFNVSVNISIKFHVRCKLTMTGSNPQMLLRNFSKVKPEKIRI